VSPSNDFSNLSPRQISFRTGGLITAVIGIVSFPWQLYEDANAYIFTWLVGCGSVRALIAVAAGAIPVLPSFINAATTEGGIIADPNFFDQLYRYGVFVAFGLAAVTYVAVMRAEIPARSPAGAAVER
jgi:nucleobase:cation symporter-1, NCS1 family